MDFQVATDCNLKSASLNDLTGFSLNWKLEIDLIANQHFEFGFVIFFSSILRKGPKLFSGVCKGIGGEYPQIHNLYSLYFKKMSVKGVGRTHPEY